MIALAATIMIRRPIDLCGRPLAYARALALCLLGFAASASVGVALYAMEKQDDRSWRISGCRIAPSTVNAT